MRMRNGSRLRETEAFSEVLRMYDHVQCPPIPLSVAHVSMQSFRFPETKQLKLRSIHSSGHKDSHNVRVILAFHVKSYLTF
jgi:hypothetical protein